MVSKEKKYEEPFETKLTFCLSNIFNAKFNQKGSLEHSSFLVKSCIGFRLLFPKSIVHQHARHRTGLDDSSIEQELPVLCKLWAGTENRNLSNEYYAQCGIHSLLITGSDRDGGFGHFNHIHRDTSPEFFRHSKSGGEYRNDAYVEKMPQREAILNGENILLKSFFIYGHIDLPIDFAKTLVELASNYSPSAIEFSCTTTKMDFLNNYMNFN